ncbi:MAG: hypothetical protein Q4C91_20375 [Eubacteriales bacterium]|nr:hypothetical protein [Eubacteriales bacterium]
MKKKIITKKITGFVLAVGLGLTSGAIPCEIPMAEPTAKVRPSEEIAREDMEMNAQLLAEAEREYPELPADISWLEQEYLEPPADISRKEQEEESQESFQKP